MTCTLTPNRVWIVRLAASAAATALIVGSLSLPLWSMTLRAPQYPKGLRLAAHASGLEGDLHEINIINHYIGMQEIDPHPPETAFFPIIVAVLIGLAWLAWTHRRMLQLAVAAPALTAAGVLVDLQWWLHHFGRNLDPTAPLRQDPFTPLVLGVSSIGNFETTATISLGLVCLLLASLVLLAGARLSLRAAVGLRIAPDRRRAVAAGFVLAVVLAPAIGTSGTGDLQARILHAPPGATIVVRGGVHNPIVVRGPLTLIGLDRPVIDGGGRGSVVSIEGDEVVLSGFVIRNSGRSVTEEAAGIKATGAGHRIEDNLIEHVYFGIHLAGGRDLLVARNRIVPGATHGARIGHGISVWHVESAAILDNRISEARDGIYLSFAERVEVGGNEITASRYGVHSMYSRDATITGNLIRRNLLGVALMFSDRLVLAGNRIEDHRTGAAAYGVLLKDVGVLTLEDNRIVGNRTGIYAESVPMRPGQRADVRRNTIAGNHVGLALQSTAALVLTDNRFTDNLADVSALGSRLSPAIHWSDEGRGNYWSQYRGFDRSGDGIGDLPHRVESVADELVRRNPLARAFLHTPAHLALEAAARMFPIYRPAPLLIDPHPLVRVRTGGPE